MTNAEEKNKLQDDIMQVMRDNPNVHFVQGTGQRVEKDGLLFFGVHFWTFCGDADLEKFLRFANINTDVILRELKAKAVHISIHVGEAFNHIIPEDQQYAMLDEYDPAICEHETIGGAGYNYVTAFHVVKQDIIDHWSKEWLDFKQVGHLPRISFYQGSDGYLIDAKELAFLQKDMEYKAIGYIYKEMLLAKRVKDAKLVIRHVMRAPEEFKAPEMTVDKNLQGILSAIDGSASTALSMIDVFLYLAGETLVETSKDQRIMKHFPGYHENPRAESYTCSKGIITIATYRCDIDDYDAQIFVNGEPLEHAGTQQFEYDKILGFIKKED